MKTYVHGKFGAAAVAALSLAILVDRIDAASAAGRFSTGSVRPLAASNLGARNAIRTAPLGGQTSSYSRMLAPSGIKKSFTPYQPSNNSTGIYAPWMTRNPYQRPMAGTPIQRAGTCVFVGLC